LFASDFVMGVQINVARDGAKAAKLAQCKGESDVVSALPRSGVPVAELNRCGATRAASLDIAR
jgi:hypothetical protein